MSTLESPAVSQAALTAVRKVAADAYDGVTDVNESPYLKRAQAVAYGLAPFGVYTQMIGLLHDVFEVTNASPADLIAAGVPAQVVNMVEDLTWQREAVGYVDFIREVSNREDLTSLGEARAIGLRERPRQASLVKFADNAVAAHPDRLRHLAEERVDLVSAEYATARHILLPRIGLDAAGIVLLRVNASLLPEADATLAGHTNHDVVEHDLGRLKFDRDASLNRDLSRLLSSLS